MSDPRSKYGPCHCDNAWCCLTNPASPECAQYWRSQADSAATMGGGPQDTYCDAFEAGASSRQAEVDELRRILDAWRGSCRLAEQRVLAAQAPAAAAQTRIETLERLLREGAALMPETDRRDQPHLERRSWCARALGALPR